MYIYIHIYIYIHAHIYICIYIYIQINVFTYMHTCIYRYILYACICIYKYITITCTQMIYDLFMVVFSSMPHCRFDRASPSAGVWTLPSSCSGAISVVGTSQSLDNSTSSSSCAFQIPDDRG